MKQDDRVIFPDSGWRRSDVASYYRHVGPTMLPHLQDRALLLRRYPRGLDAAGFFQRHPVPGGSGAIRVADVETLVAWAQRGVVEFHAALGREPDRHDVAVLDLDPGVGVGWTELSRVARVALRLFDLIGLGYALKTSGGRGLHIFLPIVPETPRMITESMEVLARLVVAAVPAWATVERRVDRRGPRVYLDYLQNGPHRTMAAVYTLRARPGAPVSYPMAPEELSRPRPPMHTLASVLEESPRPWRLGTPNDLRGIWRRHRLPDVETLRP
jgi:bifunctional non-homologous end joining protein LigD